MKRTLLFLSLLAVLTSLAADEPTKSATRVVLGRHGIDPNSTQYVELPPVPPGCIVRVYCIGKKGLPDGPRNQTDWVDYFRSNGMAFPKGGFAAYHPEAEALIIANTEDQLRLLDYL